MGQFRDVRETANIVLCCSLLYKKIVLLGKCYFYFGKPKIDLRQQLAALGMYKLDQLSGGCKKR